jgi:hypothetical protein
LGQKAGNHSIETIIRINLNLHFQAL